ncbi:hypothetical protein GCM10020221_14460 [Streptomyces thioluteus]|uniref:Peptidase S9 prolyl oligopeptidase catalytic domain-containing protein n=1 Tax=Streptomyces thioluteus TaxID=66431 RepID=A0ABN3WLV6_STRTU
MPRQLPRLDGLRTAWTDALKHRVGLIELEDIAAVREWAVASGLADPERLVLAGGSWGGYLTLLGLGTQPDAWALGLARGPRGRLRDGVPRRDGGAEGPRPHASSAAPRRRSRSASPRPHR